MLKVSYVILCLKKNLTTLFDFLLLCLIANRIPTKSKLLERLIKAQRWRSVYFTMFKALYLSVFVVSASVMSGNSADSFSEDSDGEASKSKGRAGAGKKQGLSTRAPRTKKSSSLHPSTSASAAHKRRSAQVKSGQH